MVSDFWITISQYFVGIIIFLALLFALMDSSRKYDKFREWPYFVLAVGYFTLVIWALLRATIIASDFLVGILSWLQLEGFILLVIGYLAEQHHEQKHNADPLANLPDFAHPVPETDDTPDPEPIAANITPVTPVQTVAIPTPAVAVQPVAAPTAPTPPAPSPKTEDKKAAKKHEDKKSSKHATKKEVPNWVKLLSSDEEIEEKPENADTESLADDAIKAPAKETKKKETNVDVAKDTDDAAINAPTPEEPLIQTSDTTNGDSLTSPVAPEVAPVKKRHKKTIPDGPIDLSYLASRKGKKVKVDTAATSATPTKKATAKKSTLDTSNVQQEREKMMDELFPVVTDTTTDQPIIETEKVTPSSTTVLPGERREQNKLNAIALSMGTLNIDYLLSHWQQTLPALLLLILIFQNGRFPRSRGNALLAIGFLCILASRFITGSSYVVLAVEAVGYVAIGIASWVRIKGKITHHFLAVITGIYCVILALTAILAKVVVTDTMGLQLLILLCTGTLIALLPITHSLTYNHPAQNSSPSEATNE